jgi:hypothetical protein
MMITKRIVLTLVVSLALSGAFLTGYLKGTSQARQVSKPDTLIHHVTLKWNDGVSDADKQRVFTDLEGILAEIPGAKNLWTRPVRIQPRDHNQTFVIEFENQQALEAYANHPMKKAWNDHYYGIRADSMNSVTTN